MCWYAFEKRKEKQIRERDINGRGERERRKKGKMYVSVCVLYFVGWRVERRVGLLMWARK